jgi:GR25 family glycosyltransferase involved in LPS biosynthesis
MNNFAINKLNANVNVLNMKKKIKDNYFVFKIINYDQINSHKIIIESNENKIIQFKIICRLIKKVVIKNYETELIYDKLPQIGLFINCNIDESKSLEIEIFPLDLSTRIYITELQEINDELNNIKWDKIYIINLKRRDDRKILMIEKLSEEKVDNYEFIEAYDGKSEQIIDDYNSIKKYTKIINTGHFGCLLSHIKAIKKAMKNNYENIMILEDDIIFDNNFLENIKKIKLPKYDILYLGGLINEKKVFLNRWAKSSNVMGAYGYIISKSMYNIILEKLLKFKDCVDIVYFKLSDNYNIYILNDIIKTNLESSDTSKKKYKLINMINIIND